MNTKEIGNKYEDKACEYLKNQGMSLIERNYRCKIGEIDIVAKDEERNELVFVEVKYRKSQAAGGADFAVNTKKQQKIKKVASVYMLHHQISSDTFCRFDCIMITGDKVNYVKNAFGGL